MEKTQQSIAVVPDPGSDLPYFIGIHQFLEVCFGEHVQFFDEPQRPGDFLGVFRRQAIEEFSDRIPPVYIPVKDNFPRNDMLTKELTSVKWDIDFLFTRLNFGFRRRITTAVSYAAPSGHRAREGQTVR